MVPGPGAKDGLQQVLWPGSPGIEADLIRYMSDTQEEHFARLGLRFSGLNGRRLQLIDCQNLFCEVGKYARVEIQVTRIRQDVPNPSRRDGGVSA